MMTWVRLHKKKTSIITVLIIIGAEVIFILTSGLFYAGPTFDSTAMMLVAEPSMKGAASMVDQ